MVSLPDMLKAALSPVTFLYRIWKPSGASTASSTGCRSSGAERRQAEPEDETFEVQQEMLLYFLGLAAKATRRKSFPLCLLGSLVVSPEARCSACPLALALHSASFECLLPFLPACAGAAAKSRGCEQQG